MPQPQNGSVQDGGTPYPNESTNSPKAPGTDPGNKFAAFNYYLVRDFQSFPYVIISEADVHFLKAEIYNQGIGVGADQALAETEYNEGMKASVNFWYTTVNSNTTAIWPAAAKPGPITQAQIDIFTSNPAVKFTTGDVAGNYQKIITQSWLASMFNAVETWCTVRRTGVTPKDGTYTPVTYNRLPYPDDEKTNNLSNLNAIGGNVDANVQVAKRCIDAIILNQIYSFPGQHLVGILYPDNEDKNLLSFLFNTVCTSFFCPAERHYASIRDLRMAKR